MNVTLSTFATINLTFRRRMSLGPLPSRFSPECHATFFVSPFRSFVPGRASIAPLLGPIDGRTRTTDSPSFQLFVRSFSEMGLSFSFSPHIEASLASLPTRFRKGSLPRSSDAAPERDVICGPAPLNSKWKKNRTMGEFGQRQIIDWTQVVE